MVAWLTFLRSPASRQSRELQAVVKEPCRGIRRGLGPACTRPGPRALRRPYVSARAPRLACHGRWRRLHWPRAWHCSPHSAGVTRLEAWPSARAPPSLSLASTMGSPFPGPPTKLKLRGPWPVPDLIGQGWRSLLVTGYVMTSGYLRLFRLATERLPPSRGRAFSEAANRSLEAQVGGAGSAGTMTHAQDSP